MIPIFKLFIVSTFCLISAGCATRAKSSELDRDTSTDSRHSTAPKTASDFEPFAPPERYDDPIVTAVGTYIDFFTSLAWIVSPDARQSLPDDASEATSEHEVTEGGPTEVP